MLKFQTEDITIMFDEGKITMNVQNKTNTYLYNLGIHKVYLTFGLYHDGSKVEIISDNIVYN